MINYPVVEVEVSSVYLRLKRMVEVVMDDETFLLLSIEIPIHIRSFFLLYRESQCLVNEFSIFQLQWNFIVLLRQREYFKINVVKRVHLFVNAIEHDNCKSSWWHFDQSDKRDCILGAEGEIGQIMWTKVLKSEKWKTTNELVTWII